MAKNAIARLWQLILRSDGKRHSKPPIRPPSLVATVDSTSQITVTASGASSTLGTITGYLWFRNGVAVSASPSASPLVSTGLAPSTAYSFTAKAVDSAGNTSALSSVVQATTQASTDTTAPSIPGGVSASALSASALRVTWQPSTDSGSGIYGYRIERSLDGSSNWIQIDVSGTTYDLTDQPPNTRWYFRVRAIDVAGNVSGASAIVNAITTAAAVQGDWALRSAGAFLAVPEPDATLYAEQDGYQPRLPVNDTSRKPFGRTRSLAIDILNSDSTGSGVARIPFGQTFTPGQKFYLSFRQYLPKRYVYGVRATADGNASGFKQCIISALAHSHTNFEIVLSNNFGHGIVLGYNETGNGITNWQTVETEPGYTSDFRLQPAIRNDGTGVLSPDSVYAYVNGGIDPDTGAAFTPAQIHTAKIGGSYQSQQDSAFTVGVGHPYGGGMRYPVDQWATFTAEVTVGAWGVPNASRIRWGVAPEGGDYTIVVDKTIQLGADADPGFEAFRFLPYHTLGIPGGVSVASRSNATLASVIEVVSIGVATAVGAGTLSWNATTKRLTWAEAGGTAGTPRGIAPWKDLIGVTTAGGGNGYVGGVNNGKYLSLEVLDYAALNALPSQTDTITIQGVREDHRTNLAEVIGSLSPVKATAYNAAGVQVGPTGGYPFPAVAGASALETVANGLANGAWGTLTVGNQLNSKALTGYSIIPYSHKAEVDEARGVLWFYGGAHGLTVDYNIQLAPFWLSTNQWTTPPEALPLQVQLAHAYALGTVNQQSGDFFALPFGSDIPRVRSRTAGTWSTFATVPEISNITRGVQYHPDLYSGAGGYVVGDRAGIRIIPAAGGTWTWALDRRAQVDAMGEYSHDARWNPNDRCVYIGGGGGANGVKLYKVNAAGVATRIADCPVQVYHGSSDSKLLCPSGSAANKLKVLDMTAGNYYEYTPATDTWSGVAGTLPSALLNAMDVDDLFFFAASETYDCILFFTCPSAGSGLTSLTAHVWKQ